MDNNYLFIKKYGDRRKVPKCNVKLNVKNSNDDYEIVEIDEKEEKDKENEKEKVTFKEGIMTWAKKKLMEGDKNSVNKDAVTTYWMTAEQRENFESYAVYTVEIPA